MCTNCSIHGLLIKEYNGRLIGNFSVKRILETLHEHFYWPKMKHNVEILCSRCITCRQVKSKVLPQEIYTLLPVPNEPWVDIFCRHFLGLLSSKRDRDSIFVVVNRFSKTTHIIKLIMQLT